MVSNVYSSAKKYGEYGANFLFGTGATTMGKKIANTYKNRQTLNLSRTKAVTQGFKDGFQSSYSEMQHAGGFFKNLKNIFAELPKDMQHGWKSCNKGFFKKIIAGLKPVGKTLPFLFNAMWLLSSVPDVVGRTKQDGIWGGIKETGKAITNMAVISLAAAVASPFGIIPMLAAPMAAGMLTTAILGKTFSEKKAETEEAKKTAMEQQMNQNPFIKTPEVGQNLDITSTV